MKPSKTPSFLLEKFIDAKDDHRVYVVGKCKECEKQFWHRSDYPSLFCSPKCAKSQFVKLNGLCLVCKKQVPRGYKNMKTYQFVPRRFCSLECRRKYLVGSHHNKWMGGSYITKKGYRWIWIGTNCYRAEHRVLMERYLGHSLKNGESVHHRNGNKLDNSLSNLEIMEHGKHTHLHHHGIPNNKSRKYPAHYKLPCIVKTGKIISLYSGKPGFWRRMIGRKCPKCKENIGLASIIFAS